MIQVFQQLQGGCADSKIMRRVTVDIVQADYDHIIALAYQFKGCRQLSRCPTHNRNNRYSALKSSRMRLLKTLSFVSTKSDIGNPFCCSWHGKGRSILCTSVRAFFGNISIELRYIFIQVFNQAGGIDGLAVCKAQLKFGRQHFFYAGVQVLPF